MKRRMLIRGAIAGVLASSIAHAQQQRRVRRIGWLALGAAPAAPGAPYVTLDAFRERLRRVP